MRNERSFNRQLDQNAAFLSVKIIAIFKNMADAEKLGFIEPTHYDGEFEVLGRHIGTNRMDFAVVFKKSS